MAQGRRRFADDMEKKIWYTVTIHNWAYGKTNTKGSISMKYCPYCGAELMRGAISFCSECGKPLEEQSDGTPEPFVICNPPEKTEERRRVEWKIPEEPRRPVKSNKPTYDGYYDDIVPEDGMAHEKKERDGSIALKIGLIVLLYRLIANLLPISLLFETERYIRGKLDRVPMKRGQRKQKRCVSLFVRIIHSFSDFRTSARL